MVIAIQPRGERWFTPESEKGEAKPTRFKLRDLPHGDRVRIFDAVKVFVDESSGSISTSAGMRIHLACKACLVGVENLQAADGGTVEFVEDDDGQVSDDFLAYIPWGILREIGDEALSTDKLSRAERKKSEPSPEE